MGTDGLREIGALVCMTRGFSTEDCNVVWLSF